MNIRNVPVCAIVLLSILCSFISGAQPAVTPPAREAFHIYLLMGQSNMAGRDTRDLASQVDDPRILALNANGQWVVARDPIHQKDGRIEPGVGPGIPFAREMLKADPKSTIGLVPCAVGGTPLRRWVKGGDLYGRAVSRARLAAQSGVISGVLWHQGESDTTEQRYAETYEARLARMIGDLRADLGQPELPVVVGQLGEFLPAGKNPYADTVRAAIKHIPAVVPHTGYADSSGLTDKGDHLHFNADSQRQLGERYARAMQALEAQTVELKGDVGGKRFDGIGVVDGGGATSVLLKDYPEPQRGQILDLVYKPKFGASVSALLVEIPGDGNSTQGSMPSHMHTRNDLDYSRGYTWWVLQEAKKRNPNLSLDGAAWSAPGWIGNGNFWSQDAADYYVKWLQGLRAVYGLEFDAIGCRNEKGVSYEFAKMLWDALHTNGFANVKVHAFDNWPSNKLDFVPDLAADERLRNSVDIISAHTFTRYPASPQVQAAAARMNKPIWNTEEHVYLKGFDCAISIVKAFNENFIQSGATRIVNWYGIAAVYPMEPYSETPAMLLARSPWSGHYEVREALWGYAHYGQFTEAGWQYLNGGCGELNGGGSFVTLKSPGNDYSIIIETKDAKGPQQLRFKVGGGLSTNSLCVWLSDAKELFVRQADIQPRNGAFTITLQPESIYSLSTTRGQQKGAFDNIPAEKPFPFPYYETFEEYSDPKAWGWLPRYSADIADVFELVERPDKKGKCLRQVVPERPISWAPEYMPYTVLGDDQWQDYDVSVDVYLNPGDTAGVMGRVNNVGPGFRNIPKGYFFTLGDDGRCRLEVIRGLKRDKKKLEGDAEQQALIKAGRDDSEGGEKELSAVQLPNVGPDRWFHLKLRFQGSSITGFVDGKPVVSATDQLYARGMAGLRAGSGKKKLSTPYFDNVLITAVDAPEPLPSPAALGQLPIYGAESSAPTNVLLAIVDVWPEGKMPGRGASEPEADMPSKGDDVQRISNVSRPTLTVFPALKQSGLPAPAMIVCPGGGYSYVTYNKEGTEIASWLNSNGISAVVLKYRVPHNREGALQDVQRALSLARVHAGEWNIDPKRLGVIGFSAGGNLAAKSSNLFEHRAYPAIDEVDQQSCRPDFAILVYPAYLDDKKGHIAPDLDLKARIPPTLIVHSEDDPTFVPGSKLYNAALDEARVPHVFKLYATGGHGYALHCTRDAKDWPRAALEWLRQMGE